MKRHTIYIVMAFVSAGIVQAAPRDNATVLQLKESITDSDIIFPESYDVNTQKMLEGWFIKNYTATDDRYRTQGDVRTDDDTYRKRLAALPTVIEMPYNSIVRDYIERYTTRGREQVAALLGLSLYYMPIFEQALEEQGLPLELKYLPVIESGLDPNAVSRHGATGLWQFMLATARGLDMEVSSLVDQRRDPYISSRKAAGYLKDLYNTYNDWSLAIAAYNCGPNTVNKALHRAGGTSGLDFWAIYQYLSPETRGYVPMFIAANYVMNYYPEHNISPVLPTKPLVMDTVGVSDRVHFNQISAVLHIPVDELRVLNPQYRADVIPGSAEHTYTLTLPSQQVQAYIMSEGEIMGYEAAKYARRTDASPGDMANDAMVTEVVETDFTAENTDASIGQMVANHPESRDEYVPVPKKTDTGNLKPITHKVVAGESLATIAQTYEVEPDDIKNWNSLRRNAVRIGQILRIMVPEDVAAAHATSPATGATWQKAETASAATKPNTSKPAASTAAKSKTPTQTAKATSHSIKSGETLSSIAKKYGVTVAQIKAANGMKSDALRAGATIKIPGKTTGSAQRSSGSRKSGSSKRRR